MKKLLFSLYGFAFFNKFLLLTPVYAIFMQANGLSDMQLSTMFIVSAFGTILGQFPITFITNRLGQRWSMILGQFLKIFAVLLWLVFPTYIGFFIGMFFWGIQAGFRSVAFEGLVFDSVASYGAADEYPRILGRKSTYESIGTALSASGSLLMFLGYDWVTWASVVSVLLSIVCLLMVRYEHPMPQHVSKNQIKKMFRSGMKICLKTPCLLSVMILSLLVVNVPFLDDFLSPIALQLGIQTEYVGIVSFFLLGCATLGQRFAYRFTRISDWLLYSMIGFVGVLYVLFACVYTSGALWMMGCAYMLFYGIYTLLYSRFQHMIPPSHRSVVLSLYTTLTYIVYMLVCGVIGLGAKIGDWRYSIGILGIMMMVVCVWAFTRVLSRCRLPSVD